MLHGNIVYDAFVRPSHYEYKEKLASDGLILLLHKLLKQASKQQRREIEIEYIFHSPFWKKIDVEGADEQPVWEIDKYPLESLETVLDIRKDLGHNSFNMYEFEVNWLINLFTSIGITE